MASLLSLLRRGHPPPPSLHSSRLSFSSQPSLIPLSPFAVLSRISGMDWEFEIDELGGSMVSKCDECAFESDDLLCLIQHKETNHPKMNSELLKTLTPPPYIPCSECDHSFESAALLSNHLALVHGQFGHLLNMLGGDATFPADLFNSQLSNPFSSLMNAPPVVNPPAKRNYTSAGKPRCDVCHKELCNKYFFRTHMLKMHGIVIDENKPVIANIDTREMERNGELTFRCDICSTTLPSRQQLREHKSSAHDVLYPTPLVDVLAHLRLT